MNPFRRAGPERAALSGWPWADLALGVGASLLYLNTLSPGILPADAGEYQIVGAVLGVAHPPGFALYTLLSWLITRIGVVAPATAINALSALLAAVTLVTLSRAVRAWTGSLWAGLGAALALGGSTTFWAQATTANVRMFTACAVALALWALTAVERRPRDGRAWAALALALGVAVSHHGSVVFLAAVLGLYAVSLWPGILRRPWPLLAGLLPFLAWAYFPLRAGAFGSPPNARTWAGFLDQILARGWSGDMLAFATPAALPDRLRVLGVVLPYQWNTLLLGLAVLGAGLAVWRSRRRGAALLIAFGVHTFIAITYRAPQTTEYLLPAYVLAAAFIGMAGAALGRWPALSQLMPMAKGKAPWTTLGYAARFAGAVGLAAAVGWQYASAYPAYQALARDGSPRAYAEALLAAAPPRAVILASWHWATPLWYLQTVEGRRPDMEVVYVVPRTASYGQDWIDAIQQNLARRPVLVTSFFKPEYAATPLRFLPVNTASGQAWEVRTDPPMTAPPGLSGGQTFSGLEFLGAHVDSFSPEGRAATVTAAWRVAGPPRAINFYVHALGPDGALYGQQDHGVPAERYTAGEVLAERYPLLWVAEAPPGVYTLTAGAYQPDGTRLAEAVIATVTLPPQPRPPPTAHPQARVFGAATLMGYDVDHSLPDSQRVYLHWQLGRAPETVTVLGAALTLPAGAGALTTALDLPPDQALGDLVAAFPPPATARYVPFGHDLVLVNADFTPKTARPGQTITVDLDFLAARSITADLAVTVAATGADWRAAVDTTPVGGALPTLKWIAGARLHDRYMLTVPATAAPGPAALTLGWYDAFTQQDLPLLDPRLAALGPQAPLGTVEITR